MGAGVPRTLTLPCKARCVVEQAHFLLTRQAPRAGAAQAQAVSNLIFSLFSILSSFEKFIFDFALHKPVSASPHSYFSTRSSHLRHRASDSVHPEMWFAATLHREWGRAKLPGTPNLEPRAYLTPYTLLPKPYTLHDVP